MRAADCWTIQNGEIKPCTAPSGRFRSLVSMHTHSNHSVEKMRPLDSVMALWFMAPLRAIVRRAFGLNGVADLKYADLWYNPPYSPEEVLRMETESARTLGFDYVQLAITDHDEISGAVELRQRCPAHAHRIALSEELSVRYEEHLFHIGISGLREDNVVQTHSAIQQAQREGRLDDMFDILKAAQCLVVLNHPLIPWSKGDARTCALSLLKRYGSVIDAVEFNAMRGQKENASVLELARHVNKPVIGGGDSHLLLASAVVCGSGTDNYADFVREVKSGHAVPVIKSDYFAPMKWKLFLRTLHFMAHYRQICHFRGEPVAAMLEDKPVLLDPIGKLSRGFLNLTFALGLAR